MVSMQRATYDTDLDAMEQAVDALKEAVTVSSNVARRNLYGYTFSTLAAAMVFYFDQTGRIGVLDDLLSIARTLMSAHPDVVHSPFVASNIAEAMLLRAKLSDTMAARYLVNEAIRTCQQRKTSIEFSNVDLTEHLELDSTLITASQMQIMAGGQSFMKPTDIFQLAQESLTRVPPQHISHRTVLVMAKTDALRLQAQEERDLSYLMTGLSLLQQEIDSPVMSSTVYIVDLLAARGDLLYTQAVMENSDDRTLLNRAWEQYDRAVTATPGRPRERFQTCLRWAHQAVQTREDSTALKAYEHAINILPQVVFLGENVVQRIEALRQVSGLAASSVATALTLGHIPTAIDLLEKTRGILWLQSFRLRDAQLSSLPTIVRDRFVEISGELEKNVRLHWTARRHKAEELKKIVSEIRTLPTFERFQLPPLLSDVHLALKKRNSYAVVIVPSVSYCDVIILGMDTCHLRLPTTTVEWTRRRSQNLSTRCTNARAALISNENYRGMNKVKAPSEQYLDPIAPLLSELWTELILPILKYIGIYVSGSNDIESSMLISIQNAPCLESRKRVWWCPTGVLSSLPLHAAGTYDGLSQDYVGRYVISSYTPTISALHRLLEVTPGQSISPMDAKVLLVAQAMFTDHSPLLNVHTEMDNVKAFVPLERIEYLNDGKGASVNDALEGLKTAEVVHLACHGHQDQDNPLRSGFELKDGRLTLEQLMRVETPHAQLAYLSACESAGMDESRPDEGLNLVGTMIFVGFRSVIGTMW
jgi:hypothetical protein